MNEQLSLLPNSCQKEKIIYEVKPTLSTRQIGKSGEHLVVHQLHKWDYWPGINDYVYDISVEVAPNLFAKIQVKAAPSIDATTWPTHKGRTTEHWYVRFDCAKHEGSYKKGDFDIFAGAFLKEGKVYYEYNRIPKRSYQCPTKKIINQDPDFSKNTFDKAIKQFLEDRKNEEID
jgi:hypothetical protein